MPFEVNNNINNNNNFIEINKNFLDSNLKNNFINIKDDYNDEKNKSLDSIGNNKEIIESNLNNYNEEKHKYIIDNDNNNNNENNILNNVERNVVIKEIKRPIKSVSKDIFTEINNTNNINNNNNNTKINIFKSINELKYNRNKNENISEYKNFDMNVYEDLIKTKHKINSFFIKYKNILMNKEALDKIFLGIKNHGNLNFQDQIKKEFIYYSYISTKVQEKMQSNCKYQKDSGLPIPGGNYESILIHNTYQKFNIRSSKPFFDINFDYYSKSKKNFQKFLKENKIIIEEIINSLRKNINPFLKFLQNLNCWKIKKMQIDFLFAFIYINKNDDIFLNKKLIFKLLEYISYENGFIISYEIFLKLKNYSYEEIKEFSYENYINQINFLCGFFKFYFKEIVDDKEEICRTFNGIKKFFYLENLELNYNLLNDWDYTLSAGEDLNHRYKIANFYLKLIKLVI